MKGIQRSRQLLLSINYPNRIVFEVSLPLGSWIYIMDSLELFCIPRHLQFRTITPFFSFSLEGVIGNVLSAFCVLAFTLWIMGGGGEGVINFQKCYF